jgi:hypothetical protein
MEMVRRLFPSWGLGSKIHCAAYQLGDTKSPFSSIAQRDPQTTARERREARSMRV